MTVLENNADQAKPAQLFGHPRGLSVLFMTEMWERFSYYGMRALLILYMVNYLFLPGQLEQVIGYQTVKAGLEWLYGGARNTQQISSDVYGYYIGLVWFTPILGGLVADRLLGQRRTVYLGGIIMAFGEFLLMDNATFFFGLLTLIIGNGAFKPNISTQVGGLYAPGDTRRDRAYSVFYVGVNVGAALAPLVCGTLGEEVGWHYGFLSAGIGMLIGVVTYALGQRHLPMDELTRARTNNVIRQKLDGDEWRRIAALLVLTALNIIFWGAYEQQGDSIALWADQNTDRTVALFGYATEIPTTWFQSINPIFIFTFTPIIVWLWTRQSRKGTEPSTVSKMAMGVAMVGVANLVMAAAVMIDGTEHSSWLWLVLYFVFLTLGELYVSPTGLSLVSKVAPARVVSLMMGLWFLQMTLGGFLAGYLGSFWELMPKLDFFLMIAALTFVVAVAIWAFNKPLRPYLGE
jgi:POT family proton-dependent oligopeptide transporter